MSTPDTDDRTRTTATSSSRIALAWGAMAITLFAMVSGFIPVFVKDQAKPPPDNTVSCGSAWFVELDEVPERLVPVCAGEAATRSQLATGQLVAGAVLVTGAFLAPARRRRKKDS